jgi:hypothetical protein
VQTLRGLPSIRRAALCESPALHLAFTVFGVSDERGDRADLRAASGADKSFDASYCLSESPARRGVTAAAGAAVAVRLFNFLWLGYTSHVSTFQR